MNLCIIGAGAAGLCAAKRALENNIQPTVFEQTTSIGGTWLYDEKTGVDEYGFDIHTSMYKNLRTNLPKEIMGYPDFPIKPDISKEISYISSEEICNFLNEYSKVFKIENYIKFAHYVLRVQPSNGKWEVYVLNKEKNTEKNFIFDFIMVCNGHYHTPLYPNIKGNQSFGGMQIHSHDYRDPANYKDQTVLVIGAGPSGMDLCNEISKHAKTVVLSHHLKEQPRTAFRSNVFQKPDVKEIRECGVLFEDNSFMSLTTIIYCTGYKYAFPFLSIDCGVFVEDNYVQPLYKHCVNINYPTMAFIGIPFYVCAFQMMDLQVRFVIKHIWKNKRCPSKEEMMKDTEMQMERRWLNGFKKRQAHMMGPEQGLYYDDLSTISNSTPIAPVNTLLHNESSQRFLDDLIHFREDVYQILDDNTFIYIKRAE